MLSAGKRCSRKLVRLISHAEVGMGYQPAATADGVHTFKLKSN